MVSLENINYIIFGTKNISSYSTCEKTVIQYTGGMFFFPLINFTFLIILYAVHKKIFWITLILEVFIYAGGIFWIYSTFGLITNQMLYMFTLTGVGFIVVLIAFFVAIFVNHQSET